MTRSESSVVAMLWCAGAWGPRLRRAYDRIFRNSVTVDVIAGSLKSATMGAFTPQMLTGYEECVSLSECALFNVPRALLAVRGLQFCLSSPSMGKNFS